MVHAVLSVSSWGLEAAAGKVDITPDLATEKVRLAGYGATGPRPAGVRDRLYARLLVLREGKTTVAIAALDLIGYYRNDVEGLRRLAGFDRPGRSLLVAVTHQHSGPDTLGLWGPLPGVSGVERRYHRRIKGKIADALKLLETQLRPVLADGGAGRLDPRGLCRDTRDPQVIDPNLSILRLREPGGRPVASVVNWSCHPTTLGERNRLVSADYPGALCARIEEKGGGSCLFLNGMVGGHLIPDVEAENFEEAGRVGRAVADAARALKSKPDAGRPLSYRSARILVPIENSRYLFFLPALVFGHDLLREDGSRLPGRAKWTLPLRHLFFGLNKAQRPWVESEVSLLDVGPARLLGLPAEVFPESAIGGYDGRHAFGRPTLTPGNPAPPDLKKAPRGPFLRDRLRAAAPMLAGLANDELGYLVPEYDFKINPNKTMSPRPPGHHYEETNSIGPSATALVLAAAERLIKESP